MAEHYSKTVEYLLMFTEPQRLRSKGTSEGHLVQPHILKQGHLEPVPQDHVQLALEIWPVFSIAVVKMGAFYKVHQLNVPT